jgi:hypothetical protein
LGVPRQSLIKVWIAERLEQTEAIWSASLGVANQA